jgi:hypothetical protein
MMHEFPAVALGLRVHGEVLKVDAAEVVGNVQPNHALTEVL